MTEQAARWIRVSSDGQDERNQLREVDGHIASRGYEVARTFQLHDVSASKGEQEQALSEALEDIRAGRYTVIVIAHSSRIDRRDVDVQQFYALQVRMAGGRIESAREPQFGQTDIGGRVLTLLAQHSNHEYVATLRGHVLAAQTEIDAAGAWRGKPPWGFTTAGDRKRKRLVPSAEAREFVPQIFARVIAGQSLATIARWLEASGVAPVGVAKTEDEDGNPVTRGKSGQWWPKSIGQLVRNPAYMGRAVVSTATGQEHVWTSQDEPALVDADTWTRAGAALTAAQTRKRGPERDRAGNRCALSGAVRCFRCGGPMYRLKSGNRNPYLYLRCFGTGPDRKSCGAPMVRLDIAEALADEVLGGLHARVYEITVIRGNGPDLAAQLAALDYERRQVAMRGLSWEDEDAERARIRAEYERVSAIPRTRDERRMADTGVTYGDRWLKADADGRASWLRSGEVTVAFAKGETGQAAGTRDGVSLVLVWNEDEDQVAA